MSYQEQLKKKLNRSNIKYLFLYAFLTLLCLGGTLSGVTSGNSVRLLNIVSMPTTIMGVIFLFLFVVMLIMLVRTLRAMITQKAYKDLCKEVKSYGNPDSIFAYIGKLPKNKLCTHGELRFDKKYFSYILDDLCIIRPMSQVDWGYLEGEVSAAKAAQRRNRFMQGPPSDPPEVDLLLEDNRVLNLRASNKEKAEQLLKEIKKANPMMAIGFNEKNASIYKNNPKNLRSRSNIPPEEGEEKTEEKKK